MNGLKQNHHHRHHRRLQFSLHPTQSTSVFQHGVTPTKDKLPQNVHNDCSIGWKIFTHPQIQHHRRRRLLLLNLLRYCLSQITNPMLWQLMLGLKQQSLKVPKEVLQPLLQKVLPTTLLPTAKPSQTQPKQASTAPNAPKNF